MDLFVQNVECLDQGWDDEFIKCYGEDDFHDDMEIIFSDELEEFAQ